MYNSNEYKLVCLDLDGTLLNSKHQISKETLKTLREVERKGVKIAVVTGRAGYDAKYHAELISDQAYYIGSNGSIVGNVSDGIIYQDFMSKEKLLKLLKISIEIGVKPVFFTAEKTIIHSFKDYVMHRTFVGKMNRKFLNNLHFIPIAKRLETFIMDKNTAIQKVLFFISNKKRGSLAERKLRQNNEFELAITSDFCYEVTAIGMNKSQGIKKLMKHLNIKRENIIAFGDSENDREMLKFVGHGVAMGNAPIKIQSIADTITNTNDQDGVAKVLKKEILVY